MKITIDRFIEYNEKANGNIAVMFECACWFIYFPNVAVGAFSSYMYTNKTKILQVSIYNLPNHVHLQPSLRMHALLNCRLSMSL